MEKVTSQSYLQWNLSYVDIRVQKVNVFDGVISPILFYIMNIIEIFYYHQ